jgi:hypothetical protein
MLGPDTPEAIRNVVADAVEIFGAALDRDLAALSAEIDEEIIQLLRDKIAILMLADQVNDNPEVPYISVWQSGKSEIEQIYLSPRVIDLLGYSAGEVKEIRYANLAGDRIVSFFENQHRLEGRTVARHKAEEDRREEYLGNRLWKGFYRVKKKNGGSVWVMDKAVLTKFVNEKGGNVVYASEGVLLEAEEIMEQIRADRQSG